MQKKLDNRYELDDEYISIIENNEKRSILDKVNLSPEIEVRSDKFYYSVGNIEGEKTLITDKNSPDYGKTRRSNYSKEFDVAGYVRFRINMDAQLDDNIAFHGRLLFGNSTQSYHRRYSDANSSRESKKIDVPSTCF